MNAIDYIGGLLAGEVQIDHTHIRINRDFYLSRDSDGTWTILAFLPDHRDDDPCGCIWVQDPAVCSFIEQFVAMMANPLDFTKTVTIGEKPTYPKPLAA